MCISINLTKEVLTILNGGVHHAINDYLKVPRCAAANGIQFPAKRTWYSVFIGDFNKLVE